MLINLGYSSNSNKKSYYNTVKRKWAKKWSLLNIFFKKKKRNIYIIPKKKLYYIYPAVFYYKEYVFLFKFLEYICNKLLNKRINKIIYFKNLKKFKFLNINNLFNNSNFFTYFISGFVYFFFIIFYLFNIYIEKQNFSLSKRFNKNFISINNFYCLVKNYYINFLNYNKNWKYLLTALSFDINKILTFYNNFNLKAFLSLNIFMLLLNIEELKFENDKCYINPLDWNKIRRLSFNFFSLNILKKNCISFFSFCIFELYIYNSFFNFLNFEFFDYWIEVERENSYFYEKNREDNWRYKNIKHNKIMENSIIDLYNLDYNFYSLNDFNLRIQYRIFIAWFNYIIYYKKMRYNLYIRNNVYFYNNFSKKYLFLDYNNPTSLNKTKIVMSKFDKIIKEKHLGLITLNDFNDEYSFYKISDYKTLYRFIEKNNTEHFFFLDKFMKSFNIKFMINYFKSKIFRNFYRNFWKKNLFKFYFTDNVLNCYKLTMKIKSTYKFRQVNYPFSTIHQMVRIIFALPAENILYLNSKNKQITKSIFSDLFKKEFIPFYFFRDFLNYKNSSYFYSNLNLFKYMHKLSYLALYYFNPKFFYRLLNINKLPSDIISDYIISCKKKVSKSYWKRRFNYSEVLYNLHNLKKKNKKKSKILNIWDFNFILKYFYGEWRSFRTIANCISLKKKQKKLNIFDNLDLRMFYLLLNYNTGFHSTIYNSFNNYSILYGLHISQFLKKTRFFNLLNKSNEIFKIGSYYKVVKYIPLLKNFYFQLLYEDKEYLLLIFFLLMKDNKLFINNSKNFINIKFFFLNNFIYRNYTSLILFDSHYFDNMFNGLDIFKKDKYDKILTPFIYRKNFLNYEHLFFYSLNIKNNFTFKINDIII